MAVSDIAQILYGQIKGAMFMMGAMSGARKKQVVALERGLQFAIDNKLCRTYNKIRITLDDMDEYTVEFFLIRGTDIKRHDTFEGIGADSLHDLMRDKTGLETRMPRIFNAATGQRII